MKIDTTLRQWCASCGAATVNRECMFAPDICCSGCCTPGRPACLIPDGDDYWPDLDD